MDLCTGVHEKGLIVMMEEIILKIGGMSCQHCQAVVANAISAVEGVDSVDVLFEKSQALVIYDPLMTDVEKLKKAVIEAGYEVL